MTREARAIHNRAAAPAQEPHGTLRAQVLNRSGFDAEPAETSSGPGYARKPVALLDGGSRVLLLGSEGDTDPQIDREVVGRNAQEVLS
jgi:hypothetical protein